MGRETRCVHDIDERVVVLYFTLGKRAGGKQIVPWAVFDGLKDTFGSCDNCDGKAVLVQAYLLSDGAKAVVDVYILVELARTLLFIMDLGRWTSKPSFDVC